MAASSRRMAHSVPMCYTTGMELRACNNSRRRVLLWICAGLWICLIWHFSAQPGTESELASGGISARLAELFFGMPTEQEYYFMEQLTRKLAHLTEFALLAMLLLCALEADGARRPAARALSGTALVAAVDELHQLLVPGRAGMLMDVVIDCAGGLIGLLLLRRLLRGSAAGRKKTAVFCRDVLWHGFHMQD